MITFNELVDNCSPFTPLMFLTHTTTVEAFEKILKEKKISKRICPIFNKDLVYLFYGRADYTPNTLRDSNRILDQMPVTILLKCDYFSSFYRVAPFDTGAFISNKFKGVFPYMTENENMKKLTEKYKLNITTDTPAKLVALFYSNNENFFSGDFIPTKKITNCLDATTYKSLATNTTESSYDGRNTAIEVQIDQDIPFNNNSIEIIFLPKDSIAIFNDDLKTLNINFEYYLPGPRPPISENMGQIKMLLYQYYQKKEIL